MEYIPVENRDTRYDLWYVTYQCRVPYIQTKTIEQLEEDGLPTAGDPHHDHAMQWEPILVMLPIHRIVELWSGGANVKLVKEGDAKLIFEAISRHLHAWKDHIAHSYHPNNPPYDDLLLLDRFATVIYEHAKVAYDVNFVDTHFKMSRNTSIGRRAMLSAIAKMDQDRIEQAEKTGYVPKNIDFIEVAPKYNAEASRDFIDYSGKNKEIVAPVRNSMASLFKKGTK